MYTEQNLSSDIRTAIERWWTVEQAPLLISKLGLTELSDAAREFVRENKISLKRFIRGNLRDTVRFVPMPRQGGGVAPVHETQGISDSQLENMYVPKKVEGHSEAVFTRFYPEVWAAFRDPLPDGQKRVLSLSTDRPSVELTPAETPLADGEYAIEAFDTAITAHPERPPSAAEIRAAITNWCEAKGVVLEDVTQPVRAIAGNLKKERASLGSGPLDAVSFLAVLRALPPHQLAKISFPGDVLLSLLERLNQR